MTATLPLPEALRMLPETLHLQEGEAFSLEGVLEAGQPVITRMERRERSGPSRKQALQRFLKGAVVEEPHSEQELDEARFQHLRQKHLK